MPDSPRSTKVSGLSGWVSWMSARRGRVQVLRQNPVYQALMRSGEVRRRLRDQRSMRSGEVRRRLSYKSCISVDTHIISAGLLPTASKFDTRDSAAGPVPCPAELTSKETSRTSLTPLLILGHPASLSLPFRCVFQGSPKLISQPEPFLLSDTCHKCLNVCAPDVCALDVSSDQAPAISPLSALQTIYAPVSLKSQAYDRPEVEIFLQRQLQVTLPQSPAPNRFRFNGNGNMEGLFSLVRNPLSMLKEALGEEEK
ncbi:hypothetical protein JTE90_005466 [Oedothorax gibbosus]|uniref:Uncharacterized protein n=1 Tax=Oedothorax gibbosus TaxID=931172 RepID=A0AAV6UM75_9ARAC|nr:hypothetical protein JTE90_005466 [Oedothorax gibbosus]